MKALARDKSGALGIEDVPIPKPGARQVLIRVEAASFSRADWGTSGKLHAAGAAGRVGKRTIVGSDVAGTIAELGPGAEGFAVGERVCAVARGLAGAAAGYAVAPAAWCARVPEAMSMTSAAALPSTGTTALAAVEKAGCVTSARVLVCGASGGVGQYATLLAAARGARVTAACGAHGLEVARRLGASGAVDYAGGLGTLADGSFDVLLAINGRFGVSEYLRLLKPGGRLVVVGMDALGPGLLRVPLSGRRLSIALFVAAAGRGGVQRAADLVASASSEPTIEVLDDLEEAATRLATVAQRHPTGKLVVRL